MLYKNYSIYEYDDKTVYYFKKYDIFLDCINNNDVIYNVKINNKLFIHINNIDKLKKKIINDKISFSFIIKKNDIHIK